MVFMFSKSFAGSDNAACDLKGPGKHRDDLPFAPLRRCRPRDEAVALVVTDQFGQHLAVFIDRVIIRFECGGTENDLDIEDITCGHQMIGLDLMVHIAEMPENQFRQSVRDDRAWRTTPACTWNQMPSLPQ